jgi:pimeloyl-ACP methyl ester carboxylesterase
MNAMPNRWRRLALTAARHAAWVLPGARSPWADAMRHELDYIADDRAALRWAIGCVAASYLARLAALPRPRWRAKRAASAATPLVCAPDTRPKRARRRAPRWRIPSPAVAAGSVLLLGALALQGHANDQSTLPVFEEKTCDLPDVTADIRPRLRCGTVRVPRDHARPDAGSFSLAVVVIRSEQQPSLPDPVVYISGGPGYPLTIYAAHQARVPYAPRRDLILIDQRGTGRSQPSLCPDRDRRLLEGNLAIAANDIADVLAERRAAYMACRDDAIRRSIDLANFGTAVTAEDFEWVRQALGIARWNVYGESYGTAVAMTLTAMHPDAVRSVVLDSIYPPDPAPPWSTVVSDARDAFFAHCAADEACAEAFPNLAGTYQETLNQLDRNPLIVDVPPQLRHLGDQVRMTASSFEILVSRLLYFPTAYPTLPRIIQSVHDGDARLLGTVIASEVAAASTMNRATHAAVECRDRRQFRNPLPAGANVLDRMQLYDICRHWSDPGPAPLVPARTRVPTLVLAGQFDPVARPSSSRHVAELIGDKAQWVEMPLLGHNVRRFSPCGARIAADFIDDPQRAPDKSCAGRTPPIRFVSKAQMP